MLLSDEEAITRQPPASSGLQHFVVKLHLESSSSRLKCLFVVMFGYLGPFQWRFSMGIACYLEKKYVFTYRKGKVQNWWHLPKNGQIQKPPMPKYANAFSVLIAHALQLILSAFNFTGCGKKSVLSRWSQIKSVNFNQTSHFLVHRSGTVQCVFPYFLAVLRTCLTFVLVTHTMFGQRSQRSLFQCTKKCKFYFWHNFWFKTIQLWRREA